MFMAVCTELSTERSIEPSKDSIYRASRRTIPPRGKYKTNLIT